MTKGSQRKAKLLHLQDILLEETDDDHGLTMPQIIEHLQERGIGAERKALYDDIDTLEAHGLDIIKRREPQMEYAVGTREFQLAELLLLADAVQSSRFLTKKKSEELIKKLRKLTSRHHKSLFDKSMHVGGRIKMQNDSVYYNIDGIQEAIKNKKKIAFQYLGYEFKEKILKHNEKWYSESPVALIYKDEYYYLLTYNDVDDRPVTFRVDRMVNIKRTSEAIPRLDAIKNLDVQKYVLLAFSMFEGEERSITLKFDKSLVGSVIDRFGPEIDIFKIDESSALIHVRVMKSAMFFGWLSQFGTKIKLEGPPELVEEYKAYLRGILEVYCEEE
ncbi:MAG: WYL domain-containing protein [Eggerthellaceae bacterium]|nr:WYL domain-containing protein [Eggerthellaceae bacterium]